MPNISLGEIAAAQDRRAGIAPDPGLPWAIAYGALPYQQTFSTRGEQHA
jgi:hypothetical protein